LGIGYGTDVSYPPFQKLTRVRKVVTELSAALHDMKDDVRTIGDKLHSIQEFGPREITLVKSVNSIASLVNEMLEWLCPSSVKLSTLWTIRTRNPANALRALVSGSWTMKTTVGG
jgi:hypothetical protein